MLNFSIHPAVSCTFIGFPAFTPQAVVTLLCASTSHVCPFTPISNDPSASHPNASVAKLPSRLTPRLLKHHTNPQLALGRVSEQQKRNQLVTPCARNAEGVSCEG